MMLNMAVNNACIHVEHYITLLTILSELSEGKGRVGEGKERDEKELMHR